MATITVPIDPRPQFSELTVIIANTNAGRPPLAAVERVVPDRYVLAPPSPPKPRQRSATVPSAG